jgi:hypothetical protein
VGIIIPRNLAIANALYHRWSWTRDLLFYSEDGVAELFRRNEKQASAPRLSDGSLYGSFHVDVTPTTLYLDGPFTEQSNHAICAYAEHQALCGTASWTKLIFSIALLRVVQ